MLIDRSWKPGAHDGGADRPQPPASFPLPYVLCQVAGWGLWALGYATISLAFSHAPVLPVLASYLLFAGYGIVVTHLMRAHIHQRRWMALPTRRLLPRMAVAVLLSAAILTSALALVNDRLLHLAGPGHLNLPVLLVIGANTTVMLAIWLAIYSLVYIARRRREAELEALRLDLVAREARYRSLSAQVNPHFLFNSLNSLRALIVEDPRQAVGAVTHLAGVLRYSLNSDCRRFVPLREELEAVEDYLALERIRFEERLRVQFEISPETLSGEIPPMILQHLVENAVKHGIAPRPEGGDVRISCHRDREHLVIEVWNPLPLSRTGSGSGTGLENSRQRLSLLYGAAATCGLGERNGSVVARLRLPWQIPPAAFSPAEAGQSGLRSLGPQEEHARHSGR